MPLWVASSFPAHGTGHSEGGTIAVEGRSGWVRCCVSAFLFPFSIESIQLLVFFTARPIPFHTERCQKAQETLRAKKEIITSLHGCIQHPRCEKRRASTHVCTESWTLGKAAPKPRGYPDAVRWTGHPLQIKRNKNDSPFHISKQLLGHKANALFNEVSFLHCKMLSFVVVNKY